MVNQTEKKGFKGLKFRFIVKAPDSSIFINLKFVYVCFL